MEYDDYVREVMLALNAAAKCNRALCVQRPAYTEYILPNGNYVLAGSSGFIDCKPTEVTEALLLVLCAITSLTTVSIRSVPVSAVPTR